MSMPAIAIATGPFPPSRRKRACSLRSMSSGASASPMISGASSSISRSTGISTSGV
tara:strand:+ start:387 stop:554 length:168 start_codon:yes stop_codon:yes gene_type:complete